MPNTRISDLTPAVSVAGTDVFPSVQTAGVGPVKTSLTQITNFALANAAAGAAGTPSIAPTGDTNTGFWFPAADTIAASTSGTERLRITSAGNLGIGTTSPSAILDVQAAQGTLKVASTTTTNTAYVFTNNAAGNLFFGIDNSGGSAFSGTPYASVLWYTGSYPLIFATSGVERMRLDASGNLVLGAIPAAWSETTALQLPALAAFAAGYDYSTNVLSNAYRSGATWYYMASSIYATQYQQISGEHRWLTAASGTAGNAISFTQAMTLDASGRLGIGTTSPSQLLEIGSSATTAPILKVTSSGSSAPRMQYDCFGFGSLDILVNATGSAVSGVANGTLGFGTAQALSMVFATNNTERLRITSAGNIHPPAGSTSMTDGFFYMPAASGAPSGTPTAITGTVPFYYDTTNNQFYVYNGAWKKVALS